MINGVSEREEAVATACALGTPLTIYFRVISFFPRACLIPFDSASKTLSSHKLMSCQQTVVVTPNFGFA